MNKKPNFEKMVNGKLVEIKPTTLNELFDCIRCDWVSCHSTYLSEEIIVQLN